MMIKQKTANISLSIKIVTGIILMMTVGFFIGSIIESGLFIAGILLGVISILCYLYAPVAYAISNNNLLVLSRINRKTFGPVTKCARITGRVPGGIRLWGNGGLFAGTGIFWNKSYGIFRAYVTSSRKEDLVLVDTAKGKVVITPEDPDRFIESWASSNRVKTRQ